MKRYKFKFYTLIFLMLLTAVSLSTATYSWFSTNRFVYISELHIKVKSKGSIELSADAINWKTELTQNDIIDAYKTYENSTNQLPLYMEPVSTGKNVTNGKLDMFYGISESLNGFDYLVANKVEEKRESGEESDGKFMAFDLFIKSTSPTKISLSNVSKVEYFGDYPGVENSVRFAFLIEGNSQDYNAKTIQNMSNATQNTTYIWEPNANVHTQNGIKNAKKVYNLDINENNMQILYDGIVSEIKKRDKIVLSNATESKNPNLFKRVDVDYATIKEFEEDIPMFNINEGITKIRVYIWIEGQDVDCENNSAVGNINFNFQFTSNL